MQKPNPFPGMNPFMDQRWHDAHHTLIGLIRRVLGQELPENYSALAVAKPDIVTVETPPERWVEVRDDDGELVTVIEVISPTNRESGRAAFLAKRGDYIAAGVNVVEVDLLRGGRRLIDIESAAYQNRYGHVGEHYTICTIRSALPQRREIYICALRERLPVIRIPLRHSDPDVPLDVQSLVDEVHVSGRYWKLDYQRHLDPALSAADQTWIEERVAAV